MQNQAQEPNHQIVHTTLTPSSALTTDQLSSSPQSKIQNPNSEIPPHPLDPYLDQVLPDLQDSDPSTQDSELNTQDSTIQDLPEIRDRILLNLAVSLDHAADRLCRSTAGQSAFRDDSQLKAALSLLKILPPLLDRAADVQDQNEEELVPLDGRDFYAAVRAEAQRLFDEYNPHVHSFYTPRCPICLKGPAAHWARDCPEKQPHHDLEKLKQLQERGRI
jgi:hypothetical protein